MIIVAGKAIFGRAEDIEPALELGREMIAKTRAERGCIDYTFSLDVVEKHTIRIFEMWESQEALDAHFRTPHMAAFNQGLRKLALSSISVEAHDVTGTKRLM